MAMLNISIVKTIGKIKNIFLNVYFILKESEKKKKDTIKRKQAA